MSEEKEKRAIVKIEESFFECTVHGLYEGKIISIFGDKNFKPKCPECEKIRIEFEEQNKRKVEEIAYRKKIEANKSKLMIPLRYQEKKFESFQAKSEGQISKLKICKSFAENFSDMLRKGSSMILCGNSGTGKTHLACSILSHVADFGFSGLYARTYEMTREIKSTFGRKVESENDAYSRFASPDLLVLDEVGAQFGSETEKLILFEILGKRYDSLKPSILISNLEPQGLSDFIGARVVDRMKENGGKILIFDWESKRA